MENKAPTEYTGCLKESTQNTFVSPSSVPPSAIQRIVYQRSTAFMSPTDRMVSPCTRKLITRKGPHHPFAMHQRKLLPQPQAGIDGKENIVTGDDQFSS